MDIPLSAKVKCQDKVCGKVMCAIIRPIGKLVTHIVVQEKGMVGIERLIPVEEILDSQNDQITLRCSLDEFSKFESFTETHYIDDDKELLNYEADHYRYFPFSTLTLEIGSSTIGALRRSSVFRKTNWEFTVGRRSMLEIAKLGRLMGS